jgi:hypothetical protein
VECLCVARTSIERLGLHFCKRYYALYSNTKKQRVDFYYRSNGITSDDDRFYTPFTTVNLADGNPHTITLAVYPHPSNPQIGVAELLVDNENPIIKKLSGTAPENTNYTLSDCGDASTEDGGCVFYVGQRAAPEGKSNFNFRGSVYDLQVYNARLPGLQPMAMAHQGPDTMAADLITSNGGGAISLAPGVNNLLPVSPLRKTERDFTIALDVQLNEQRVQYLFCKSTVTGSKKGRSLCMFTNSEGHIFLYYHPKNAKSTILMGPFADDGQSPVVLSVGTNHTVSLTMTDTSAIVSVDATTVAANLDHGPLGDCVPGSDCVMFLGQRASSGESGVAFTLNGTIYAATIDYYV